MGLIANLLNKLQENEVRKRVRALYHSLRSSLTDLKSFEAALEKRSHWQKTSDQSFEYQRYGEIKKIAVHADESTLELIKKVANAEIQVAANRLSEEQQQELVTVGLKELDKLTSLA